MSLHRRRLYVAASSPPLCRCIVAASMSSYRRCLYVAASSPPLWHRIVAASLAPHHRRLYCTASSSPASIEPPSPTPCTETLAVSKLHPTVQSKGIQSPQLLMCSSEKNIWFKVRKINSKGERRLCLHGFIGYKKKYATLYEQFTILSQRFNQNTNLEPSSN